MKREDRQGTVRIDRDLLVKLEKWLESGNAKDKGFHSKAPFVNAAVRMLLEKYSKPRFEHMNFQENIVRLIDNKKPKGTPYVELFLKRHTLMCSNCETDNCIHVRACWDNKKIRDRLKAKQVRRNED